MESYITIISTLLGTIVGFFLSWLKEYIQGKPKLKTSLKKGKFYYYKELVDEWGNICKNMTSNEEANRMYLLLRFDVFNIGKSGTGITDISIRLKTNKGQIYHYPKLSFPLEHTELIDTSFNLEANTVQTIEAELDIVKDQENSYLFENINIVPDSKNKLMITVIVKGIGKQQAELHVEPISILCSA